MKISTKLISILILPCLIGIFYIFKPPSGSPPQECHANVRTYIETSQKKIYENININIIFDDGYYNVIGTIKTENNNYTVHREGYFSKANIHKNSQSFTIKKETLFIDDNTPDELWEKTSLPRPYDIPFYFVQTHLKDNLILYSSLSNPLFICASSE